MKKLALSSLAIALMASSTAANAAAEFGGGELSFNATLASNYLWRGFSLTDDDFAVQGGVDYEHESGLYVGTWASNYKYFDEKWEDDYEIDLYGGYYLEVNDNVGLDFGVIRYFYGDGGHTTEWYVGADLFGVNVKANYDQHIESWYYEGNYDLELPADLVLGLHAGYYDFDDGYSAYDLGAMLSWALNDYVEFFGGAVYQEDEKDNYVAGVNFYF